jgi:hypothetical protein
MFPVFWISLVTFLLSFFLSVLSLPPLSRVCLCTYVSASLQWLCLLFRRRVFVPKCADSPCHIRISQDDLDLNKNVIWPQLKILSQLKDTSGVSRLEDELALRHAANLSFYQFLCHKYLVRYKLWARYVGLKSSQFSCYQEDNTI